MATVPPAMTHTAPAAAPPAAMSTQSSTLQTHKILYWARPVLLGLIFIFAMAGSGNDTWARSGGCAVGLLHYRCGFGSADIAGDQKSVGQGALALLILGWFAWGIQTAALVIGMMRERNGTAFKALRLSAVFAGISALLWFIGSVAWGARTNELTNNNVDLGPSFALILFSSLLQMMLTAITYVSARSQKF
eukprot:GILJ01010819.1.p1 GENE.GILJ01010819.1~~GILJ01010819.1.p1  ORF type:complete len:191 (-),score=23.47 GILJ01010819.1:222-794(-)